MPAAGQKRTHRSADPTHLPGYTHAWGDQPPPWLHLPSTQPGSSGHDRDKENSTGLPASLRSGIETLSGLSLNDVQVHYNSPKPAEVQALAYTQGGTDIHVGPGQ